MIENANTEFKREYNDKVNKVLLSFLNTDGGSLFIGIDDNGEICGVEDSRVDALLLKTVNSFRDSITPDPTGYFCAKRSIHKDKTVIEITVERGSAIPYCFAAHGLVPNGVYVRIGSESVTASREHIRQMIRENGGEKFVDILSLEQSLTFEYADNIFADKGIAFAETQKKTLGVIRTDGRFSNLSLLMSDQCPYSIKAAIFQGTTKEIFKDRKDFTGSVFKQLDDCLAYMNVFNKVSSTFAGAYRVDHPDYPEIVLREALINAVLHRDYFIEGGTYVRMYDDRIEIMSHGGILPGVTKELMLAGISLSRNDKLAAVFHRLKLIEAYGTGIPRIFETYAKFGVIPKIPITNEGFLITLPNLNANSAAPTSIAENGKTSKNEQRILELFADREFTKQDAASLLGISESGAYKLLARMIERGTLKYRKDGKQMLYSVATA